MSFKFLLLTGWAFFSMVGALAGTAQPVAVATGAIHGIAAAQTQPAPDLRQVLQVQHAQGVSKDPKAGKRLSAQEQALLRQQLRQFNRNHPPGDEGPGSVR